MQTKISERDMQRVLSVMQFVQIFFSYGVVLSFLLIG